MLTSVMVNDFCLWLMFYQRKKLFYPEKYLPRNHVSTYLKSLVIEDS